jgi:hypothetical protein
MTFIPEQVDDRLDHLGRGHQVGPLVAHRQLRFLGSGCFGHRAVSMTQVRLPSGSAMIT